jgi:uncharacterized protein VirK/YbjX
MPTGASQLSLRFIFGAARKIYPGDLSLRRWKRQLIFLIACLIARPSLRLFLARNENGPFLCELEAHPETLGFVVWPYIHAGWSVMQRFEALAQHRRALKEDMTALDVGRSGSVVVADLSSVSTGVKLVADRASWFWREGSMVLNLFLHDERLMSLAFSFGQRRNERVVYVGSVQGSNIDSALTKYREIAKDLHGMRARDFLIKAFQFLMHHLRVKEILCISDEYRHHRHAYFGKAKAEDVHLNYDDIWQEHGGERMADGFFRLASLPAVRPLETIAAKNRALYRRRYEMMNRLSNDIGQRFRIPPAALGEAPEDAFHGTKSTVRPN